MEEGKTVSPVSMLTIRQAGMADAGLIADMSRQTFYDSFASQNTKANMDKFLSEQFTRESLIEEVAAPGNIFLLAYVDENPAGYVRLRENNIHPALLDRNAIELARIYAVKEAIGRGVGHALMEKVIALAKEKAKTSIWLGVWEKNERAIAFYHKWGFKKFADHVFLLGDDPQNDWLMVKEISDKL